MQRSKRGTVDAIASRDLARAKAAAKKLGIKKAYGSYEELLADPDIDAIYNPLPNNLHIDWTIAALKAGKHVLCEKPFGMNAKDAARVLKLAGKRHVMEAFMIRYHPQWLKARELIRAGKIGELKAVQVFFTYNNRDPEEHPQHPRDRRRRGARHRRLRHRLRPLHLRGGAEAHRVAGRPRPGLRTDRLTSVIADFGEGRQLTFTISTQLAAHQRVTLGGTKGRIEILIPFNAPQAEPVKLIVDNGSKLGGASSKEIVIKVVDQYAEEADAFAKAVLGETELPYGPEDGIKIMQIIDAMFRSEKTGRWEKTGL